jgi:hypothetical protein
MHLRTMGELPRDAEHRDAVPISFRSPRKPTFPIESDPFHPDDPSNPYHLS